MIETSTASFCAGLCLGACLAAGVVWLQRSSTEAGDSKPQLQPSCDHETGVNLNDEVTKEHLSRNILFFGSEGCSAILSSHVVVIGLGGVGSHAAHLLLRSGVGKLTLVDFDQVNRACPQDDITSVADRYQAGP